MSESLIVDDKPLIDNKDNNNTPTFTGEKSEEKSILKDMGFEEDIINTIYKNMNPVDLQEALDYLNKNEKGKFTHSYLVNENNVCTICGKGRSEHESDVLFVENDNPNHDEYISDDDENDDFLDDLIIRRNSGSNSNRFNAYENSYRNSVGKDGKKKIMN